MNLALFPREIPPGGGGGPLISGPFRLPPSAAAVGPFRLPPSAAAVGGDTPGVAEPPCLSKV